MPGFRDHRGKWQEVMPSPRERKKKPARCSHCQTQFAGTGPHLIRLLYDAGWRVRFQDGQLPTLLLCPDCQSM